MGTEIGNTTPRKIKKSPNLNVSMSKLTITKDNVANIEEGKVFECGEVKMWKCRNCGHIHIAVSAPQVCPVCAHPRSYFEIKAENY